MQARFQVNYTQILTPADRRLPYPFGEDHEKKTVVLKSIASVLEYQ